LRSLRIGRLWPAARSSLFGILFLFVIFLLLGAGRAAASWSPSVTATESGTRYGFGQDVGPDGTGVVVWSAPLADGEGYTIDAREIGVDGQLGSKVEVSEADPGAAHTSAYAPTVRYDAAGTATVVWMESTYSSDSCFAESDAASGDCVVDEYVRARQIDAAGSLSSVRVLQHRQAILPREGSFGGTSPAYVTYGQPLLAAGPSNALTVLWPESSFGNGCAAYGYSRSYSDSECEADQRVKWIRLSAAGLPQGTAVTAYESKAAGYGSGEQLVRLRAAAAADGTVTVLFRSRRSAAPDGECWGGESSVAFFRIGTGGVAGASKELDSGCGSADPDLAVDPGGAAVAVWDWELAYSGDEALYARIDAAGSASTPQSLLDGAGSSISGLDLARGAPGSALAVWAAGGSIRSRRIPFSGALGAAATIAAPPAGRFFAEPRLAAAPDGSAVVAWESEIPGAGYETALQASAVDADGTVHDPRTLLAANRRDHGSRVSAGPSGSFLTSWRISVPRRNRIQSARFGVEASESNDAFADAQALETELPSFASGSNAGASKQAGEPSHAGVAGGASVWFRWTPASSGPVTLATCASDGLDPVLAVYTGSSLGALSPVAAAGSGAPRPCSAGDAGVRFDAVAGTTYRIAVDGEGASEGTFGLKLTSREDGPANDAFAAAKAVPGGLPRSLSTSNEDASREAGEPQHAGNPGGASVWFSWTAPAGGKTKISACGRSLDEPLLGVYTGSALASLTEVGSAASGDCSSVPFQAVAGTTYRIAVDGKDGREGSFQLRFIQAPSNDDLAKAQPLSGPPAVVSGSNAGASKETGEPDHAGDPGGSSVWYSWTPSTSGTTFVSACLFAGKGQSALLAVYTGNDPAHLNEVAADAGGGSTSGCFSHNSEVSFSFQAGTRYLIALDGPGGVESSFSLRLEAEPANDDFAAAQPILGDVPQTLYGTSRHATKEPGEPAHAGNPGGASVWYSWTPSESGIAVLSACDQFGGEPPLLGVYSGESVATLTEVTAAAAGGEGCYGGGSSKTEFDAVAGESYYIALDDPAGAGIWGFYLKVDLEFSPANDGFGAATEISPSSSWFYGSNRHATTEPGEPQHAGGPGGASVWFKWTPAQDGLYAISTCAYGPLDPLLAVYTGSALGGLGLVADDDDGGNCSGDDAEVRFVATAGTAYRIAVDGKAASTGNFEVQIVTPPENDDFGAAGVLSGTPPLFISGSNWLATKEPGEPSHSGDPGGASVWYSWTPSQSSITELTLCSYGPLDPLLAVYTGSAPAGLTPLATEDAGEDPDCHDHSTRLKLNAQAGTTYRIAVDGRAGSYGEFSLELRGPPANDDFAAAKVLGVELPRIDYGDNRLTTAETGEPAHAGVDAAASVWYAWTPVASETVRLTTCSYGSLDPLLAVYTGSSPATLEEVSADDDDPGSSCSNKDAKVVFEAHAGTTYRIAVDDKEGDGGWFELHLSAAGPANNDFADATQITQVPGLYPGTTVGADAQMGESGSAHQSVWYRMQADHNGIVRLHTCSDDGEPMDLDVFTGSSLTALSQVALQPAGTAAACDSGPGALYGDTPALAFEAVAGTSYWISADRYQQISPVYELRPPGFFALAVNPPANDLRAAAERIPYGGASLVRTNIGATHEDDEPEHAGDPGGGSVWFRWFAAATGRAQLETCGSEVDTLLAVYAEGEDPEPEGDDSAGEEYGEEPPSAAGGVTSNDDSDLCGDGSVQSSLELAAEEGTEYLIAVDGKAGASGEVRLSVAPETPDTTPPDTHAYIPSAINTHQLIASLTRDEPESGFECALDGAPFAACELGGSDWYPYATVSGLEEGTHTLEVREVDAAGNVDPTPEHRAFKVDMVPPQTSFASGPEGLTRVLGSFGLKADEPTFYFECALDGAPLTYCNSPYFLPQSLADGQHTVRAVAIDEAGNHDPSPATRTFVLDRTPPVARIDEGPSGTVEANAVEFEFSADEASTFDCEFDGKPTSCENPRSYTGLADAEHRFEIVPTDTAGNVGAAVQRDFRVEARPPETTIKSGPIPYTASTAAKFTFAGDEELSGFECALDGESFEECESGLESTELADGPHKLRVRAVDLAGKQDPTPPEWEWVVDTRAPETSIALGPSGLTRSQGPFEFSADEEVDGFECAVDGAKFTFCLHSYWLPDLPDGPHTLLVRAVDRAGNADSTPAEATLDLDTTAPEIEITGPPPALTQSKVSIEFELDDPGATTRCWVDNGPDVPCASPFEIEGLEDGAHTISILAADQLGNQRFARTEEFTVDEQPPETWITDLAFYTPMPARVFFAGSNDAEEYRCSVDEGPFSECTSPLEIDGLPDGEHRVRVYAIDSVGNVDPTPEEATFVVDTVAPDTTITEVPEGPVHDPAVPFGFESSEELGGFECSMDGSSFRSCAAIEHDRRVGTHLFEVRAFDQAGNVDPTPASSSFTVVNQAPSPLLELDQDAGPGPLEVAAAIDAGDDDDDPLRYELQFGDGTSSKGELPHADLSHTYEDPGVYVVRLEVDDGFEKATATETVTVGPPEPLSARAGDDRTAVVGEPIRLDGGNSRPLRGIDGNDWAFGDGGSGSGEVVTHTYEQAGTYEAQLTVSRRGEKATDTATITVLPPAPGTAKVTVLGEGSPLAEAEVVVVPAGGSKIDAVTDANGVARLHGLADGSYTVSAYKPGYRSEHGELTVTNGAGSGQVELHAGELATATVESHPMTLEEIEAAGIDPDDPDNQHVFQLEAHINLVPPSWVGPSSTHGISASFGRSGFAKPPRGCFQISARTCRWTSGGSVGYTSVYWGEGGVPLLSSLVIPFRATFLKEFYDVSLIVNNLAPSGFDLRNGSAAIEVPGGMSLAPTAKPQSLDVSVPDVPGGGSATVHWVLRGDKEGEYDIAAHYGATLEPFGRSIKLDGRTAQPIKVWGGSALKLEVDVDDAALNGYPYKVFVKLKNVADVPVYNPSVELLKEGRVGYIEQPRQRREYGVRELLPGAVHTAGPFVIVPEPTGKVDLAHSFIRKTAGDVELEGTIVTHPRSPEFSETPEVETRGYGDKLVLDWEPVPGAEGYQIFRTLDRKTDFPDEPLAAKQLDPTRAVIYGVDPDEPAFYGISSLLDPQQEMVHPLTIAAGETNREWPKLSIDAGDRCDSRDTAVDLRFEALDFELASYEMTLNGPPFGTSQPLSGYSGSATVHVPFAVGDEDTDFEVVVRDSEGTETRRSADLACDYVALGDSYSSGEGVPTNGTGSPGDGGKFLGGSDSNGCHRARIAYPRLVKANADPAITGDRLKFHACSGAVLSAMYSSFKDGEVPQLEHIGEGTHLVTLSMGGNDMHFRQIIEACVKAKITLDQTCRNDRRAEFEHGYREVQEKLPKLLREIRQRAPRARILVVAYPQIFPSFPYDPLDLFQGGFIGSGLVFSCHTFLLDNINPWDIVWLSGIQKMASEMIEDAVNGSGSGAEYVSMGDRFGGHDVCQEFDPWFNGTVPPPDLEYSFHPNAQGQQAMADALLAKLGQSRPASFFQIHPGEIVDRTINVLGGGTGRAAKAVFSEYWPGSDVELTLESPSGRVIGRDSEAEDVQHELGPTFETYVVEDPEAGEWKMRFKGVEVAPEGEKVTYEAATTEEENVPPIAQFNQSLDDVHPGQQVSFDASGSSDADGQIEDYEWNFDDGSGGSGKTVQHSFAAPGLYEVRLLVRDDDGEAGVFAQEKIWVRSNPSAAADHYEVEQGKLLTVGATAGLLANDTVDRTSGAPQAVVVTAPGHGSLDLAPDGSFEYQPDPGFTGSDTASYRVLDAGGFASTPAALSVTVRPTPVDPGPTDPGPSDPGHGPISPGGTPAPGGRPASSPPAKPKPLKCRKGFKKKKVHGKPKCVKAKKKKKHR